MKIAALLPLPLVIAAAASIAAPAPRSADVVWTRLGQTAVVGPVRVTPLRILEDSRCPANVACVWAGRLRLAVRIVPARGSAAVRDITLGQPFSLLSGQLILGDARPARRTDALVPPQMYRFGFRWERGSPPAAWQTVSSRGR